MKLVKIKSSTTDAERIEALVGALNEYRLLFEGTGGVCIHCGQITPVEETDHWRSCPEHPAREVCLRFRYILGSILAEWKPEDALVAQEILQQAREILADTQDLRDQE